MPIDSLGDRMKSQYEDRTRVFLPRRTYTIIRLDGKAFHTFTRNMNRPYDINFMGAMDAAAMTILPEIMGSEIAYIQSDEISLLLTDFAKPNTEAWFDGNVQKMVSVSAAMATVYFLRAMAGVYRTYLEMLMDNPPLFDSRVFTIPDYIEVENYFIWRQKDAERNSIQMLAQHHYSHNQLHQKSCSELQDMIHDKGDNWNDHPARFKRGGLVFYNQQARPYPAWELSAECPVFTSEDGRKMLRGLIPRHWEEGESTRK